MFPLGSLNSLEVIPIHHVLDLPSLDAQFHKRTEIKLRGTIIIPVESPLSTDYDYILSKGRPDTTKAIKDTHTSPWHRDVKSRH